MGQYITLTFLAIDIWNKDSSDALQPCPNNYVIVYDISWNGQKSTKGRYCAANNPRKDIQSSWETVQLRYLIDTTEGGSGFMAKYEIIDYVRKDIDISDGKFFCFFFFFFCCCCCFFFFVFFSVCIYINPFTLSIRPSCFIPELL